MHLFKHEYSYYENEIKYTKMSPMLFNELIFLELHLYNKSFRDKNDKKISGMNIIWFI